MERIKRKGRDAKIALRAAPISEEMNPIKPGLLGGSYKPLSEKDIKVSVKTPFASYSDINCKRL